MSIWILRERDDVDQEDWAKANNTSYSPYVDPHGFVVVAENEQEARRTAAAFSCEDEPRTGGPRWLDPVYTTCKLVHPGGHARVILGDWPTG